MISFSHPTWLVALVLIPLAWLQWTRFAKSLAPGLRGRVALIRSLVLLLLILALAGPRWAHPRPGVDVLLLVDASDSMLMDAEILAEQYYEELEAHAGPHDRVGLVYFGREAQVAKAPQELTGRPLTGLPDGSASDIERGLRVAASLSPIDRSMRTVVISDGRETLGSALDVITALRPGGMPVDVISVGVTPETEVMVDAFILPEQVGQGEPFMGRVVLISTGEASVRMYLFRNGNLIDDREVQVNAGRNLFQYSTLVQETGVATYELHIESSQDTLIENNTGLAVVNTTQPSRVLILAGRPDESRPLYAALEAQGLDVDLLGADQASFDVSTLSGYAALVLHNVSVTQLSGRQLDELDYYVRQVGGGLVMIGGDRSFGLGGYSGTALERLSPLQVEAPQHALMPTVAMALVIDKSGSMNEPIADDRLTKLDLAKEAVLGVSQALDARDLLGVVAFDSRAHWTVPLQSLADRQWFAAQVLRLVADGGTNAFVGLQEAYASLVQVQAGVKHVILLSDGYTSEADFETLIRTMHGSGITVSTVGVGDADTALLQRMAEWGAGRSYYTDDPYRIPYIFASETRIVAPLPYEERRVVPVVIDGSEFLYGLPTPLAPLDGYLVTHPKDDATVHVVTDDNTPLMGSWRYGLGRVVAFTGGFSAEWGSQWVDWDAFGPLWTQVIRWSMRPATSESLQAQIEVRNGVARLWVDALSEAGEYLNFLDLHAEVRTPDGSTTELKLEQAGPGRYEATFPAAAVGTWTAAISSETGMPSGPHIVATTQAYAEEYRILGVQTDLLAKLAARSGGRVLSGPHELPLLFNQPASVRSFYPLWPWLVLMGLLLFMVDLGLRYVPRGTVAYTLEQMRERQRKAMQQKATNRTRPTLAQKIQSAREQERTTVPLDSRQSASREAHTVLARMKKERQASKETPSKPVDS